MTIVRGNAEELDPLLPGQDFHSTWSSPESLARHMQEINRHEAWHSSAWDTDDGEWRGCNSMQEAVNLALDGWKEGAEMVEKMRNRIAASRPQSPRLNRHDMVGAVPNVPRAVSGEVKNMRAYDPSKSRRKPVITLVSDMAVSYNISSTRIANRAAAVACIIDEVEAMGYSVEVISVAMTKGWHSDCYLAMTSVVAKRSDYPVDIKRIAFALGHPAMFRRFVFATWSEETILKDKLGYGLGSVGNDFDTESLNEKAVYVLPSMQNHSEYFKDIEAAMTLGMDSLMAELKKQKCPPFIKTEIKTKFEELKPEEPRYDEDDEDDDTDF